MPTTNSTDLVEEVGMHVRDTLVRPPTVDEQQLREETELAKRVVCRHRCLRTFMSKETTADVRLLNHRHVVRAVTDRESHSIPTFLDLREWE